MNALSKEFIYYAEPKTLLGESKKIVKRMLAPSPKKPPPFRHHKRVKEEVRIDLSFDALNPLLAKQLTEVEMQLGQLALVQSEIAEERRRMNSEMNAIKELLMQEKPIAALPVQDVQLKQDER